MKLHEELCVCRECGHVAGAWDASWDMGMGEWYTRSFFVPTRGWVEAEGQDEWLVCGTCGSTRIQQLCGVDTERARRLLAQ